MRLYFITVWKDTYGKWADKEKGLRQYIEQDGMNVEEYRGGVITPAVGISVPMYTEAEVEATWDDEMQLFRIKEVDEKIAAHGQVPYPLVYLTPEEQNEIIGMETDLHTYIDSMEAKFITGENSFDELDNYVKTIEGMGVDKLIEIYQTAYDRWNEAE